MSALRMPSSYKGATRLSWEAEMCALHGRDGLARLQKYPARLRALKSVTPGVSVTPEPWMRKATLDAMVRDALLERLDTGSYRLTGFGGIVREAAVRTIDP